MTQSAKQLLNMWSQLWFRLVGFGFRLLYNELAWTYDGVSWLVSLGHWRAWQRAALPFVVGQRVLEVGHGPGHLLAALQAQGTAVTGLDISPFMGRMARRRLGAAAPLVQAQVQALPYSNAVFDTVLATFPTNYILAPQSVAALWRVLRPNGRLIIVPEGHLTNTGLLHTLIDWLFAITGQRASADELDVADFWADFVRPFQQTGFSIAIHSISLEGSAVTVIIATKESAK